MSEQPTRRGFLQSLALGAAGASTCSGSEDSGSDSENKDEGPSCGKDNALIIEVPGKDHPEGHHIRLYDLEDQQQQEWLENQVEKEDTDTETLHVWDWQNQPNRNVWLEVDTEDDTPIRLPFLRGAGAVPRQTDIQDHEYHVLMPVVPMTLLSGVTREDDNPAHPVLARPGYLYIFIQGVLWRELEIRQDDSGQTRYHDIRLLDHRDSDWYFADSQRPAVGSPLQEIWLPARVNNTWQTLEVAYSESQLPAARLNRLEEDDQTRQTRCTTVNMEWEKEPRFGLTYSEMPRTFNTFPVSAAGEHRPRRPGFEFQFDRPTAYLHDLDGNYPENALEEAEDIQQRHDDYKHNYYVYEDERPEMDAWGIALQKRIEDDDAPSPLDEASWNNAGSTEDALAEARERGIAALPMADPLYRLRHLQQRYSTGEQLMELALARAKNHDHHHSGILVQSLIAPETMDGDDNPLNGHYDELTPDGKAEAEKSTAYAERTLTRIYLNRVQQDLLAGFQSAQTEQAIADLFCYEGWDYAGAFQWFAQLTHCILRSPAEHDPLYSGDSMTPALTQGRQWLYALGNGTLSRSILGDILLPRASAEELTGPYEPPEQPQTNDGTGAFRATALAALQQEHDADDHEAIRTPHGESLANSASSGELLSLFGAFYRTGTYVLMSVHGELDSALDDAIRAHTESSAEARTARSELRSLRQQQEELRREQSEARRRARRQQHTTTELENELNARQQRLEQLEQELAARQAELENQAQTARMRVYARSVEHLRASTPSVFANLTFDRLSNALQNDYYILGLTDQPDLPRDATWMYGDIRENGRPIATTNQQRAQQFGIPEAEAQKAYVLVLPKNDQTAQRLSQLTWAENRAASAQWAYNQASADKAQARAAFQGALADLRKTAEELDRKQNRQLKLTGELDEAQQKNRNAAAKQKRIENNRWYKALNTPVLPVVVMLAEGYNVSQLAQSFHHTRIQRGSLRAGLGLTSGIFDFALASAVLVERFGQGAMQQRIASQLAHQLKGNLADEISSALRMNQLTAGRLAGGLAGFAVAGISLWDAVHAWRMGNQAAWGHASMAAGGIAMGLGAMGAGAKTGLVFLGPWGWIGLGAILSVSGFGLVAWLDDEPMDTWLRHGPFGDQEGYPHLKDAEEAHYRLVGLIVDIQIQSEEFTPTGEALESLPENLAEKVAEANHVIRVSSPVSDFFSHADETTLAVHLELNRTTREMGPAGAGKSDHETLGKDRISAMIQAENRTEQGREIYIKAPEGGTRTEEKKTLFGGVNRRSYFDRYEWAIRAQASARISDQTWLYPAPLPSDKTDYGLDNEDQLQQYQQPDFSDTTRNFWADEQNNHVDS